MTLNPLGGPTNFMLVGHMNNSFGNAKGFPRNIDWDRIAKQSLNIADELAETFVAMGADKSEAKEAAAVFKRTLEQLRTSSTKDVDLNGVRDGLSDIHVFAYGAHHLMGIDADRDLAAVVDGVMTRFIKDPKDKVASTLLHAAKGVTDVVFEGEYPHMIMRSNSDQPDAPKHKFLKSASYIDTVFYPV